MTSLSWKGHCDNLHQFSSWTARVTGESPNHQLNVNTLALPYVIGNQKRCITQVSQLWIYPFFNAALHQHVVFFKWPSDNNDNNDAGIGLSPVWCQFITRTDADWLSIGPFQTNFSEILSKTQNFHSRKCIWKCYLQNGNHFIQALVCYNKQIRLLVPFAFHSVHINLIH